VLTAYLDNRVYSVDGALLYVLLVRLLGHREEVHMLWVSGREQLHRVPGVGLVSGERQLGDADEVESVSARGQPQLLRLSPVATRAVAVDYVTGILLVGDVAFRFWHRQAGVEWSWVVSGKRLNVETRVDPPEVGSDGGVGAVLLHPVKPRIRFRILRCIEQLPGQLFSHVRPSMLIAVDEISNCSEYCRINKT
jgi:hypothetical protein